MSWFDIWSEYSPPQLAEETEQHLKQLKIAKLLTVDEISTAIQKLHTETRRIKSEGVSVWNAKAVMPKIFDVVDGAFVSMEALVDKIAEQEARIEALEKK